MTTHLDAMSEFDGLPRADSPKPKTNRLQPWMLVCALASIACVGSATDVLMLLDTWHIIGEDAHGWTIGATILLVAIFVGLAFVQSVRRRTSASILALSAAVLVDWLSQALSAFLHVHDPSTLRLLVFPAVAVTAAALAWSNRWPWLAALLICVPTVGRMLEFAIFALAVSIYGF